MSTTTKPVGQVVFESPVFTASFDPLVDSKEENRKLVSVKSPKGLVDMFGRRYPARVAMWVHHFDDYGVLVEGTYEIMLARKALKAAGYEKAWHSLWGYRPTLIGQKPGEWPEGMGTGGRPCVAFYFDVEA